MSGTTALLLLLFAVLGFSVLLAAVAAQEKRRRLAEAERLAEQERRTEAQRIATRDRLAKEEAVRSEAETLYRQATEALGRLRDLAAGEYLPHSKVEEWSHTTSELRALQPPPTTLALLDDARREFHLQTWADLADPRRFVAAVNDEFVATRLTEDSAWFDGVEQQSLTQEQRLAIVRDEDNNLVIAGAGTGKTSTIVGKVSYLLRRGLAKPDEVLVLAYGTKAVREVTQRLSDRLAADVEVRTFHSLGLAIIAQVEGKKPDVSVLAGDKKDRWKLVVSLLAKEPWNSRVVRFFTDLLFDTDPACETTSTPDARYRRLRTIDLRPLTLGRYGRDKRTHSDVKVKSVQELQIGNWLTLNGITWKYETKYPHPTSTAERRQYQPDFFLPDYCIYIEHFGIQRDGRTAPGMDAKKYVEEMQWKHDLHKQHGTTLVESYSYDFTEKAFPARLASQLQKRGVQTRSLAPDELRALAEARGSVFANFVKLICNFLDLFKGNRRTKKACAARASTDRDRIFLEIFYGIYDAYENRLAAEKEIDFHDMLGRARTYAEEGTYRPPYKYILVDEFQDISENRLALIRALRFWVPGSRLFCVGDDWQSIYRFAGSDISLLTEFPRFVGPMRRTDLGRTFRFGQSLADFSSLFIMRNDEQIEKTIISSRSQTPPQPVRLVFHEYGWHEFKTGLSSALCSIRETWRGTGRATVLVLGRYKLRSGARFEGLTEERFCKLRKAEAADLDIDYNTIHSSKGLEADFVILLDNEAGTYGFPSEVADDPVLRMVLSSEGAFPHAEERRLFYVAVTRARYCAYLLAPSNNPSTFVQEILEDQYSAYVDSIGEHCTRLICPQCLGRTIRRRDAHGKRPWWACLNFPHCAGKLSSCPSCSAGAVAPTEPSPESNFRCSACEMNFPRCPTCKIGFLSLHAVPSGAFLGCSQFRKTGCNHQDWGDPRW